MKKRRERKYRNQMDSIKRLTMSEYHTPSLGQTDTITPSHEQRLDSVVQLILKNGAKSVLDLGCGSGALYSRLVAESQLVKVVGMEPSLQALHMLEQTIQRQGVVGHDRCMLIHDSLLTSNRCLKGFDVVTLIEVIEHFPPQALSKIEHKVFAMSRPSMVVITTPNQAYNKLLGLDQGQFRHLDHYFEWDRPKFQSWAIGVANRCGYQVRFEDLGPREPGIGSLTQMGIFQCQDKQGDDNSMR